jgi:hypothetical protein
MLNKYCYSILLEEKYHLKRYKAFDIKVEELAERYKDKIVLMRIDGHLTTALYGQIFDIWNTSNEWVDLYWLI